MTAKSVKSIIEMSQEFHKELVDKIQHRKSSAEDERLSAALEYLESVEKKTTEMIEEVPSSNRDNIMDTFIRYYPVDDEEDAQAALKNVDATNLDSLMSAMIDLRQKLINIYDLCSNDAQLPEVKDLMENIRDFEVTQLHDISRQMNEIQLQK